MNRKGLSPLIATILLISFAVALGAMIVNWSADFESHVSECDSMNFQLQDVKGVKAICFNEESGNLKFVLENSGEVDISSVLFRTVDFTYDVYEMDVPSSKIEVGGILSSEILYEDVEQPDITLIPLVEHDGDERLCPDHAIHVERVLRCDA
ncbi:hypothetical protein CMO92_05005 [Candidatus Woesearchaeota archaeon]|nr:hypothetical protein [Candidatus Woesearchaeota archaeon]